MYRADPKGQMALNSLKSASKRVVNDIGSLENAAALVRVSGPMMSLYCDKNRPSKYMPIDILLTLEAERPSDAMPPVTQYMADFHGYLLVAKPETIAGEVTFETIADVMTHFSEFMAVTGKSLGHDGDISADEIKKYGIEKEIQDVIDRLVGIKQAVTRIRELGDE